MIMLLGSNRNKPPRNVGVGGSVTFRSIRGKKLGVELEPVGVRVESIHINGTALFPVFGIAWSIYHERFPIDCHYGSKFLLLSFIGRTDHLLPRAGAKSFGDGSAGSFR